MILEKAIFVNRAPFEKLELDFKAKGVNVLTAINGKGKTTIISYIVDSLYEAAQKGYRNEFEDKTGKYYRVSSPLNVIKYNVPSIVYLRYSENGIIYDYIDVVNINSEFYQENIILENSIPFDQIEANLSNSKSIKLWSNNLRDKEINRIFDNNILTYFPSYRFEQPLYLNDPYSIHLDFTKSLKFNGYLTNPIEVISDLQSLTNWMLDLLLDLQLAQNRGEIIYDKDGNEYRKILHTRESEILRSINTVVSNSLSSKNYTGTIRIGISSRNFAANRICIMNDVNNEHHQICPSIFALSTGELALITIFAEILRQNDNNHPNSLMNDIKGIVLIDEVDKHLHISLQKDILPKMFKLFPNVQFIVSSHSPFLNMGLADELPDNNQIIDLDNGGLVSSATNNAQYQEVYEMMLGEKQKYAEMYQSVMEELSSIKKPLIITEGKTDIKHILKAKEKLGITDFDFETISESKQPDGDINLLSLLKQLSNVKNPYKIIGIFDCDNLKNKDIKEISSEEYKNFGNNVYAFCIKAPQFRKNKGENEISIEHLYSDDEIHTSTDESGRHLFFGNEFSEKTGRLLTNSSISLKNQGEWGKHKVVESVGGQAVYDESENNILSTKNCFAEAILNDTINVSATSWTNFQHIFDTLRSIIEL